MAACLAILSFYYKLPRGWPPGRRVKKLRPTCAQIFIRGSHAVLHLLHASSCLPSEPRQRPKDCWVVCLKLTSGSDRAMTGFEFRLFQKVISFLVGAAASAR